MAVADELVGASAGIQALRAQIARLLARQGSGGGRLPPILILGETGAGKGLLARMLHRESTRRQQPLVEVNCAAIPETLVEAELFGVERGAFTDARQSTAGLFRAADGGVLFLDEIGMLPLGAQAKLLTVLDQRRVRRVGGTRAEAVDTWVLSATNEDLAAAMATGKFRVDLYHRIAPVTLRLPPLRERGPDILELAEHFLERACADYDLPVRRLTAEARRALLAHAWPGNVRELANLMERAALLSEGGDIALDLHETPLPPGRRRDVREQSALEAERDDVRDALEATNWNLSRAAARLGVPRNTLRYRIERLGLRRDDASAVTAGALGHPRLPSAAEDQRAATVRWERRWITALRVEVGGPAGLRDFHMTPALENAMDKASSFGATVDDVHPLGFTALYGLVPMEDAPLRAALTAQAIHTELARTPTSEVAARAAVHVADCLVARGTAFPGVDSGDHGRVRGVLGDLVQAAPAGSTLVSGDGARFLRRAFELEPLGAADAAVPAPYRVGRHVRAAFRVPGQPRSPFVGRDRELAQLADLLAQAERGRGQLVGVAGEPGVGKSRLLFEFRQGLERGRVTYLEGHCAAYGQSTPYLPVVDLGRAAFQFTEADPPPLVTARLSAEVDRLGLSAEAVVPYLLHVFGVRDDDQKVLPPPSPEAMRLRAMEALRQVLVASGQRRPMVVAIEDAQWIDPTSEEIIAALAESIAASAVLLLVTYRHGYQPSWLGKSYASQIALRRLARAESQTIIVSAGRAAALAPAVVDEVVARADGNPFFLEELARAVSESDPSRASAAIPETVQGVLTARLDRLPPEDRDLLQAAAVIGREGAVSLLREIAGLPEEAFGPGLSRLRSAEFLHETAVVPTPHFAFEHVLTQEAAYRSLAVDRRRALHVATATAIERLMPGVVERSPELLARHCTEGGRVAEAIAYWHRAGQFASRRCAHAEAIAHLTRGLELVETLPSTPERLQGELGFRLALVASLIATQGEASDQLDTTLARARELVRHLGDSPQLFPVRFGLWRLSMARAQLTAADETATSLIDIAERGHDRALLMAAHVAAGSTGFYRGQFGGARTHLEQSLSFYESAFGPSQVLVYGQNLKAAALGYLALTLAIEGNLDRAAVHAERGLEVARRSEHPFTLAFTLMLAGLVRQLRRERALTGLLGEELLVLARDQGFIYLVTIGLNLVGWGRAAADRAGGLDLMREGARGSRRLHHRLGLAYRTHLAESLVQAGMVDEGLDMVDFIFAHAAETAERSHLADVHRVRGEALALLSRPAEAQASFAEAFDLAVQQGARLFALRAATASAHLSATNTGRVPARDLARLASIYAEFTEGLDLDDLRTACGFLEAR